MKKKCENCKYYDGCNKRIIIKVRYRKETTEYINPKNCKGFEAKDE